MSCITENTMVVRREDEEAVWNDFRKYENTWHRLNGFKEIYKDDKIIIYIFDANGDSPWELESGTVNPIALETNYLDGERPWTRVNGQDYGWPLRRWLKGKIPDCDYEGVLGSIEYSKL